MISGYYALDLVCDYGEHRVEHGEGCANHHAADSTGCYKKAKRDGWRIYQLQRRARCPGCVAKMKKPPQTRQTALGELVSARYFEAETTGTKPCENGCLIAEARGAHLRCEGACAYGDEMRDKACWYCNLDLEEHDREKLCGEARRLSALNAELVAALEVCDRALMMVSTGTTVSDIAEVIAQARAALSKARP